MAGVQPCCETPGPWTISLWVRSITNPTSARIRCFQTATNLASCLALYANRCFPPLGLSETQGDGSIAGTLPPHSCSATRPPPLFLPLFFLYVLLQCLWDNIPPASCLDKLMPRCQSPFWCIPPALASSWPRTPAPTTETFQGFSGSVFTLQQIALFSLSESARWTEVTFSHPDILHREPAKVECSVAPPQLFKIYRIIWASASELLHSLR